MRKILSLIISVAATVFINGQMDRFAFVVTDSVAERHMER